MIIDNLFLKVAELLALRPKRAIVTNRRLTSLVPHMGRGLRVAVRPCTATVAHGIAVPFQNAPLYHAKNLSNSAIKKMCGLEIIVRMWYNVLCI